MAITRIQKEAIIDLLGNKLAEQKAVVLLTTHGKEKSLDSKLTFELRSESMKKGIKIKVVKNTLVQKVFSQVPDLIGPTYLAFIDQYDNQDEIYIPKNLISILDESFTESFDIVGSIVNGSFLDKNQSIQLSKTPSLLESLSRIAGSLKQVTAKIAITINEVPTGLSRSVSEYSKTLS